MLRTLKNYVRRTTLLERAVAHGRAARLRCTHPEGRVPPVPKRVIVEPKPGASGVIASEMLTRAAPDGYTLLMLTAAPEPSVTMSSLKRRSVASDCASEQRM